MEKRLVLMKLDSLLDWMLVEKLLDSMLGKRLVLMKLGCLLDYMWGLMMLGSLLVEM
jgi:hypothetical protein